MVAVIPNGTSDESDELSRQRLERLEQRYGTVALDFACHAAFPLMLTTDLSYCLRETFFPEASWYVAADVLLSGLCHPASYDLYEMEGQTRYALLQRLIQRFGEARLWQLDQFMKAYLRHRLDCQPAEQDRLWLLGDRPHWTALACLRPDQAFIEIQQALQQLVVSDDLQDRFRLASLIESYGDLLSHTEFRPILLDWAKRARAGNPIDETSAALLDVVVAAKQAGFPPLRSLQFEIVTIVFREDGADRSEDELHQFTVETVTVDRRGQEIQRSIMAAWQFIEPLRMAASDSPPATIPQRQYIDLEMVAIPSGKFQMGSPQDKPERYDNESPQHWVTVPPFFLSKYPITQAQWQFVAGLPQVNRSLNSDPSHFKGEDRPVEQVSWHEAVEFCDRLSQFTGREYRLPTEAEWEYACRAGTTTPFYFGETMTGDLANYNARLTYADEPQGEERSQTTPIGSFPPNAFGLYDMHGNVWEWCQDHWHGSYEGAPNDGSAWVDLNAKENAKRLLRGGSWIVIPRFCRAAARVTDDAGVRSNVIGFRVVCSAPRTR